MKKILFFLLSVAVISAVSPALAMRDNEKREIENEGSLNLKGKETVLWRLDDDTGIKYRAGNRHMGSTRYFDEGEEKEVFEYKHFLKIIHPNGQKYIGFSSTISSKDPRYLNEKKAILSFDHCTETRERGKPLTQELQKNTSYAIKHYQIVNPYLKIIYENDKNQPLYYGMVASSHNSNMNFALYLTDPKKAYSETIEVINTPGGTLKNPFTIRKSIKAIDFNVVKNLLKKQKEADIECFRRKQQNPLFKDVNNMRLKCYKLEDLDQEALNLYCDKCNKESVTFSSILGMLLDLK